MRRPRPVLRRGAIGLRLDDDGYSTIDDVTVAPGMEDAAGEGAAACPRQAITVVE